MAILFHHLSGTHQGRVDRFSDGVEQVRLGRASDNDVRMSAADTIVSSRHAEITLAARGFVIQDLGSRNGTLLNGQMVERAPLSTGDTIQLGLGGPQLRFEVLDETARAQAEYDFALLNALLEASDAVSKYMGSYLNELGLTSSKFNTLQALHTDPRRGVTQNELGSKLTVTGANITGVIDRLERDNLVVRETHPTDRRANIVRLTDEGTTLIQQAEDLHAIRIQQLASTFDEAEKELLLRLLEKISTAAKKNL